MNRLLLLRDVMEGEEGVYRELLTLSEQEKDAVIQNDVKSLSSITEQQQTVLDAIKKLEADKGNLLSEIQNEGGWPEGRLRVQDVILRAKGPLYDKLQSLVKELEDLNKKIRRISALNKTLIETQLQYTMFSINTMAGQDSSPGMYSGSGRVQESTAQHCLVDQAI